MGVTLKDIAGELGLSPATVSRALNGFPEVSETTRARVSEVAARLGYAPNPIARRLVGGRSGLVGMVVPGAGDVSADPSFMEVLAGLGAALTGHGLDLVLHVAPPGEEIGALERLVRRGTMDGFILIAPRVDDPRLTFLEDEGVPFAVHGRVGPGTGGDRAGGDRAGGEHRYDHYDIDNRAAGRMMAEHLIGLGHRRIALLNGPVHLSYAAERRAGHHEALDAAGLPPDDDLVIHDMPTHETGRRLAAGLLDAHAPPTAVACSSTAIASGVYAAAHERGLEVGRDLAVGAHDDAPPHIRSEDFVPPLTVTVSPLVDACEPLAAMIARRIEAPDMEPDGTVAPVRLEARASTGAQLSDGPDRTDDPDRTDPARAA